MNTTANGQGGSMIDYSPTPGGAGGNNRNTLRGGGAGGGTEAAGQAGSVTVYKIP